MAKEVISLSIGGNVNTEFHGFEGKSCLKAAAEIAQELERLGVVSEIADIRMKDTAEVPAVAQQTEQKVEEDI